MVRHPSSLSFRFAGVSLLVSAFAGCHGIGVQTTHDEDVDFAQFRSFDLMPPAQQSPTMVSDETLLGLVAAELEKKGLQRRKDGADLLVAVHRSVEGALNTRGSGYEFRDGRMRRYELQEGTLVVDLVRGTEREVVWRGTAQGAFKFDSSLAEREAGLRDVVRDMFAGFPPRR
ncbi:MAG: DUF4136 domain-containing protein [Planctomycetes bacterium]|nr:DUF4136 domain-containing protein [Planctomycetota bacterium]